MKRNLIVLLMGLFIMGICASTVLCSDAQLNMPKSKEFRLKGPCHLKQWPVLNATKSSIRAYFRTGRPAATPVPISPVMDCHAADPSDPDVSQAHFKEYEANDTKYGQKKYMVPVSAVVTPKDCSRCHRMRPCNTVKASTPIPWRSYGK